MRRREFIGAASLGLSFVCSANARRRNVLGGNAGPGVPPGPNLYYDTTTTLNGWAAIGASFAEWDSVSILQAGTVTKLRVAARGGLSDQTVKIAIYDSGDALLGSATTGTIPASSAEAFYEATLSTGIVVSATTYKLAIAASGSVDIRVNTVGTGNYAALAYASFPAGTLPSPDGTLGTTFVIGAYVD